MIWMAATGLLLVLLSYFLFAPFYLEIDSDRGLVQIRFHHLCDARLLVLDGSLIVDFRIVRWTRRIDLLASKATDKRVIPIKKSGSKISWEGAKAILRSFKVNRFNLNLDCGDVELNGLLFPLFFWLSRITGTQLRIDFMGVTNINLQIENNAARIIRAFIFR
jgi:hypothetical protein